MKTSRWTVLVIIALFFVVSLCSQAWARQPMVQEREEKVTPKPEGHEDLVTVKCYSPYFGGKWLTATIVGTNGNDNIQGTPGNDVIHGLGGNDIIYGGGGNDVICGGDGNDKLYGNTGTDTLWGENGNDTLYSGGAGPFGNWLDGGPGHDTLKGGPDSDQLVGGSGNDKLYGYGGKDFLYGEGGNDTLDGGEGNDECTGGPGSDTYDNCETIDDPMPLDKPLPDSQQPPPSTGVPRAEPPKSKFWDLEVEKVIINGQTISYPLSGPKPVIQLKVGDPIHCTCYYKIKTIPIINITKLDAKHWGSGNLSYEICATIYEHPDAFSSVQEWKILERNLPKFTYEDVENWKPSHVRLSNKTRKTWTSYLEYNWVATAEYIGAYMFFSFWLDHHDTIKETNDNNNGDCCGDGKVAQIVVIP